MDKTEVVLTYIGTVLIAMEFVRKFTDLQAFMGLIVGWPVARYFRDNGIQYLKTDYNAHKLVTSLRLICSLILSIITLPLTIAFYIIWFIILGLNSFQNLINKLYYEGKQKYRWFYLANISINLFARKTRNPEQIINVKEKQVMKEIEKRDLPILPLMGIILITIAFIMYFI
ncbi:MAG: hypothetical protein A2Z15_00490 [Chloroflexi bacterium RBG_16_50_11]|nr:MAG: hypothetical protein A2Z15_00490 [Chloroflexi bacterium RBG_16_50_11]